MTHFRRPLVLRAASTALALTISLGLSACESGEGPSNAAAPKKDAEEAAAPPAPPRPPIAATTSEWTGVEARLIRVARTGQFVQVEIELANVGTAPVAVTDYSAAGATVTDEASQQTFEPFATEGPPAATSGLSATLAPGEKAVVSATFPVPAGAERLTIAFPKIGTFSNVAIERPQPTPTARPERRNRNANGNAS